MGWNKLKTPLLGKAIYSFNENDASYLKLKLGDTVIITEECEEWYHGHSLLDSRSDVHGIFPKTYVRILHNSSSRKRQSFKECSADALKREILDEILSVLYEWFPSWRDLYLDGNELANVVNEVILEFISLYREIQLSPLTKAQLQERRVKIISKIDFVNNRLEHDLVPRLDNRPVDGSEISLIQLFEIHEQSATTTRNATTRGSIKVPQATAASTSYRLQVQITVSDLDYPDDLEIVWNIFNAQNNTVLCEPYHQNISKDCEDTFKSVVIFEEFWAEELLDDLNLVVNIFRKGHILGDSTKRSSPNLRRPIGWGMVSLARSFYQKSSKRIKIKELADTEINKLVSLARSKHAHLPAAARAIQVTLIPDRITPGTPSTSQGIPVCRRLTLQDKEQHNVDRDTFYLHLNTGDFEKGNKSTHKSIEVRLSIRNSKGELQAFLGPENNPQMEYASAVHYKNNSPDWHEVIQINLPDGGLQDYHVFFEFYHCSSREKLKSSERSLFAYSCLQLCGRNGLPIASGSHSLTIKREDNTRNIKPDKYLHMHFLLSEIPDKELGKDTFTVDTNICSTKRTNNEYVMNFLNWRNIISADYMARCLLEIQRMHKTEFYKTYLQKRIVNNILEILSVSSTPATHKMERDLFLTLQTIVQKSTVPEKKLQDNPVFFKILLMCLKGVLLELVSLTLNVESAGVALDNSDYIISGVAKITDQDMKQKCLDMITDICNLYMFLMKSKEKGHLPVQELILENFPRVLKACSNLLSDPLKASYIQGILQADIFINFNPNARLRFLSNVIACEFVQRNNDVFKSLYHLLETRLMVHIELQSDFLEISLKIVTSILKHLKTLDMETKDVIISQLLVSFLPKAVSIVTVTESHRKVTGILLACVLSLLQEVFPSKKNLSYFERHKDNFNEAMFLRILNFIKLCVERAVYNQGWMVLLIQSCQITLNVMKSLTQFIINGEYESRIYVWSTFVNICFGFILQNCLQLQTFEQYKKHNILSKYGDLRIEMLQHVIDVWSQNTNFEYCSELEVVWTSSASKVLEISLLPVEGLTVKALPFLCDMVKQWLRTDQQKHRMQTDLVIKLEDFLAEKKGDNVFLSTLTAMKSRMSPSSWELQLVGHFETLTRYHMELRHVTSSEESRRKQILCLTSLMDFHRKEVPSESHCLSYLYELSELLLESQSFLESGLALRLYSDLLDWTPKENSLAPAQAPQTRKTAYWNMIHLFDKAKAWEYGISLCHELIDFYRSKYDYPLLSRILKTSSNFYDRIMGEFRLGLGYFRVQLIGKNFPSFLKAKDFIYKVSPYMKQGKFQNSLEADFPHCEIITPQAAAHREFNENSQVIILSSVTAIPEDEELDRNQEIASQIRSFYQSHNVSRFVQDRPYHKGGKPDPNNEIKTLCIERTYLRTALPMPCFSLWCPIVDIQTTVLSPIQSASDALATKIDELDRLTNHHRSDPKADLRPFSMRLAGVLDAGVNGGVRKYFEAFFTDEYALENPNVGKDLCQLKSLFLKQLDVLNKALEVHETLVSDDVRHLHNRLVDCFNVMKGAISQMGSPKPKESKPQRASQYSDNFDMDVIYAHLDNIYGPEGPAYSPTISEEQDRLLNMPVHTRNNRSGSVIQDDISELLTLLSSPAPIESIPEEVIFVSDSETPAAGESQERKPRGTGMSDMSVKSASDSHLTRSEIFDDLSQVFGGDRSSQASHLSVYEFHPSVPVNVVPASSSEDLHSIGSNPSAPDSPLIVRHSCPSPTFRSFQDTRGDDSTSNASSPGSYVPPVPIRAGRKSVSTSDLGVLTGNNRSATLPVEQKSEDKIPVSFPQPIMKKTVSGVPSAVDRALPIIRRPTAQRTNSVQFDSPVPTPPPRSSSRLSMTLHHDMTSRRLQRQESLPQMGFSLHGQPRRSFETIKQVWESKIKKDTEPRRTSTDQELTESTEPILPYLSNIHRPLPPTPP